jgi:hypothetical protein
VTAPRADLPPDPFDDPAMRDFGGPYADRELPSDRWVATGGLYEGRAPRGALPRSIRAAKLTMYLQAGLLVLLLTPVWDAGLAWAVPVVLGLAAGVAWLAVAMVWGRPQVRQIAIWLELALIPFSVWLWLSGTTGSLVSFVVAVVVSSMLLTRRAAELNLS